MNTRRTHRSSSPLAQPLPHTIRHHQAPVAMVDDPAPQTSTAAVSVFAPISVPVLRSVDPTVVVKFLKEPLPYTASIDRTLLKSLFYMGKFDNIAEEAVTVNDLTDENVQAYINSLVRRSENGFVDHVAIETVLADFVMPMKIAGSDSRITTYCSKFFEHLESIGCGDFRDQNSKKTVRLLMSRIQPPALKRELRRRVEFDQSLEKNVKSFIRVFIQEAPNCEVYGHDKS
eukprot:IDg19612t1